ncbi:putative indolepyruvate ferredoxin oxidoreductase, alpha subunit [delta proteobacterium NaphS2]|nr:putative indolepyruvate ferredoxin oxidoreductase, alpha subunit [delta proteobacterium NaphS2]
MVHPITQESPDQVMLLMGNEAIARGIIEAGASIAAAYPGNPSSDIVDTLAKAAKNLDMHVEWSVNEKVALEVAAAAAMTGLRGVSAMKQNGLNVACDFLLNLNLSGIRGGLVLVICDDPSGISSTNEQDSRLYAKMGELPLLEPSTFQEAKDMTREAFELSEKLGLPVLLHSVTRLSHARGNVTLGPLPGPKGKPSFDRSRPFVNVPAPANAHRRLKEKIERCRDIFESSPRNFYQGPERPDVMLITTGAGLFYSLEGVEALGLDVQVGILKVGTTFPLPSRFLLKHLKKAQQVVFVEEGAPFLESGVKELYAEHAAGLPSISFLGKAEGALPQVGELNPDVMIRLLGRLLDCPRETRPESYEHGIRAAVDELVPDRDLAFCAGCPHRATYWAIKQALALDGRNGFVCGDIGCYGMGGGPAGWSQMNTMQAMGSGAGVAAGMGQLTNMGLDQPVVAICGDSTFYHAAIPALINARQHGSNFLFLVLDNDATAMTGFQPHPGLGTTATGQAAPPVAIGDLCRAMGYPVDMCDPYDLKATTDAIMRGLEHEGPQVLILKRTCALVAARQGIPPGRVILDTDRCIGENCGCGRMCTSAFRCPGLGWDPVTKTARIDQAICTGCGVCTRICPTGALKTEATS